MTAAIRLRQAARHPHGHGWRRRFITGFFVTVPLIISVAALVWIGSGSWSDVRAGGRTVARARGPWLGVC